ncbi:hypothetical protein [Nonomuraea sp. NPDC050310]|uniref:hypothetical protein n=1 Tax=Nonomuraea sp. NPDC050310 TaxID=3154935 RepID=UPI0033FFE3A4
MIRGDLTPELLNTPVWGDGLPERAGIPVFDVPLVSVGGGIGSFTLLDVLRIRGVPAEWMRVLSVNDTPWQTWDYLCRASQLPATERIRSDAGARPDNIWGFPSYAVAESWREVSLKPLLQVLVEPVLSDFYSPPAGLVSASIAKEAHRIGYWSMLAKGQVRMVRKRHGGGYFTVLTPPPGAAPTKRVILRSSHVHLAVGYPGLKFLDDLQRFREEHGGGHQVVNAYEPHEHVYDTLRRRPGTVIVRGAGIVASRVLQRLMDDVERYGLRTQIVHLFRTYVTGSHGPNARMRRKGGDGWAYQAFTMPKSAFGGQLKADFAAATPERRAELAKLVAGTTTPKLRRWQDQMARARSGGWYHPVQATVDKIERAPDGRLVTHYGHLTYLSDFIIDCTGLEADMSEHRVLDDLLRFGGATRNRAGRLAVSPSFEVLGAGSGDGALYASGAAVAGNHFLAVDSFLGLQTAAHEIADDLARRGFGRRLGPLRSVAQWLRWAGGRPV